jgi:hypothetical protein
MSRPAVNLHIDTSSSLNTNAPRVSIEPRSPRTPSLLPSEKSQSPLSPRTPSLPGPHSPDPEKSPSSRNHFGRSNSHKGKLESRKLLAHLLSQLQHRKIPPSIFEIFRTGPSASLASSLGSVVQTVRSAVKLNHGRSEMPLVEDEDDEDVSGYKTDATLDLLNQLRHVLLVSIEKGWQIFYDRYLNVRNFVFDQSTFIFVQAQNLSMTIFRTRRDARHFVSEDRVVRAPGGLLVRHLPSQLVK